MKYTQLTILFIFLVSHVRGQALFPESWALPDGRVVTRSLCRVYTTVPPQYEYCNDTSQAPFGMKGDTTTPKVGPILGTDPSVTFEPGPTMFHQIVFLMQQNKELSDRLDRAELRIDTLGITIDWLHSENSLMRKIMDISNKRYLELKDTIDWLEKRPYLFIDTKPSSSGIWLTNSAGEYQWLIKPFNYR